MMAAWVPIEHQETPYQIVGLDHLEEVDLKPNIVLRALEMHHAATALGYATVEYRSKLRPDLVGLPQTKLRELRDAGESITHTLEIPLLAYTGDTQMCETLLRPEFCRARVVLSECTFFDENHRDRARIGRHLHVEDLPPLLEAWEADTVVLIHASRRTHLEVARQRINEVLGPVQSERVELLMDHRRNRQRYDRQLEESGQSECQVVDEVTTDS